MARYIKDYDCAKVISEKFNIPLGDVIDIVYEIPTADVVEVVHAEWMDRNDRDIISITDSYMCSRCGRVEEIKEPYCHCGAKMDGGKA